MIVQRKFHQGFWTRFGRFPKKLLMALKDKQNIWVHAVSIGEVLSVVDLIQKLEETYPQYQIVISTVTQSGYNVALSKFKNDHFVIYAPLDLSFVVRRYLRFIQPKIYIATETEIWPNLFVILGRNKIPIVQVNGRMSDRALEGYKKIGFIIKRALRFVDMFCMQSEGDAEKILSLGVDKNKVCVVGNMKFDDLPEVSIFNLKDFGFRDNYPLWIAGSTHPGEELLILNIYRTLIAEFPEIKLVLAPRHVERTGEIVQIVEQSGFQPVKFSQIHETALNTQSVVILDTIGHLKSLYNFAKVVFIGKSLTGIGGQNIIEPAFFGKPVIVGPNMQNFKDVLDVFVKGNGVIQVNDAEELTKVMRQLLNDPQRMKSIGQAAQKVIEQNRGASEKTLNIITQILQVRA